MLPILLFVLIPRAGGLDVLDGERVADEIILMVWSGGHGRGMVHRILSKELLNGRMEERVFRFPPIPGTEMILIYVEQSWNEIRTILLPFSPGLIPDQKFEYSFSWIVEY
jgi:hypothetical protein